MAPSTSDPMVAPSSAWIRNSSVRAGLDCIAVALLLVGSFIVPGLGWLAGVALLWSSPSWTARQKLMGTLVIPLGLSLPAVLSVIRIGHTTCYLGGGPHAVCTGGESTMTLILHALLMVGLIIAASASAIHLVRRRRSQAA